MTAKIKNIHLMNRRTFVKNTTVGSVALFGITGVDVILLGCSSNSKLKDNFWLWGQTAGSHHENNTFGLPGVNIMELKEGCGFLDIEKCLRVSMGSYGSIPQFNKEAEKKRFKRICLVGNWSRWMTS